MIIFGLILLGLCFGSFINAYVWRLHQQSLPKKKRIASDADLSISTGRSMCTNCKHTLAWYDLLPVFSWLILKGRCRYCKKSISWQYPLVEIITAVLFVSSYLLWPGQLSLDASVISQFVIWLVSLVGLVALTVYDIRWMLLPNKIVFLLTGLGGLNIVIQAVTNQNPVNILMNALGGFLVAGGIFYVLFQISEGKWIGGGDVKLGFAIGLLLGTPSLALLMLFLASIIGLLVTLPTVVTGKTSLSSRVPFGPFLIVACIFVRLLGEKVIDWYSVTFLYL